MIDIQEIVKNEFEILASENYSKLERFVYTLVRNNEDAKDIVQETLITAYHNFDKLKNKEAFLSFIFTIASRKRIDHYRKNKRISLEHCDIFSFLPSDDLNSEEKMDLVFLYEAIDQLPQKIKEAVLLFEIYGFKLKEVANIQSASVSAVKLRLYRGRKKLKSILEVNHEVIK